jgi:hypothetical protein
MKSNEFKCFICKEVFEKGWTEQEAIVELNANYPGFTIEDCDMVCDDCYQKHFDPVTGIPLR